MSWLESSDYDRWREERADRDYHASIGEPYTRPGMPWGEIEMVHVCGCGLIPKRGEVCDHGGEGGPPIAD